MLIIFHGSSRNKLASGGGIRAVKQLHCAPVRSSARALCSIFAFAIVVVAAGALRPVAAQQLTWPTRVADDSTGIWLGLKRVQRVFPFELPATPATHAYFLRSPFTSWVANWENRLRNTLEQERAALLHGGWYSAPPANTEPPPTEAVRPAEVAVAAPDTAARRAGILGGRIGQYADIGMQVTGRGELGGAWTRYQPCDPSLHLTCSPSLFPQLKPDMLFGVRVSGTISQRVHVEVDYDQRREFDATNNINVFYQGFEDEVLQRLEVGDVSIQLPASRYLTQGIPTGNFGFKAVGQLGPLDFQTVFAQQRGDVTTREFQLGGLGAQQGLVQDAEIVRDDADYVEGQFFFLIDPDSIRDAPYIDALALRADDAPSSLRPAAGGAIQVYRDERINLTNPQQQAQLTYFRADGVNGTVRQSGLFRRLLPEEHYVMHPSALWIMLRSPLRQDEALAISYVTESGDTVGTLNAENANGATPPVLKLLRGAVSTHQPGQPTWNYEMHQVYQLDNSNNVDLTSVDLRVSLGEISGGQTFKSVNGAPLTLLRLFGLDEDAPADQVDVAQIYQPGRDPIGAGLGGATTRGVSGTYVIFPSLQPFLKPGPVPSAGLSETDAQAVLGTDANRTIYEDGDPINRESGGRFRLNFKYRLKVEGAVSSFNLGAFGIRENSERLYIGDRQLDPSTDYTIDYDLGTVTLNDAPGLFAANPGAQIRATWEQKSLFQIAPTSVFGLNARYALGRRGELNFVTLYQSEKTIMTRPQLGVEPSSILLGGASGRIDLGGNLLDRALARVPGLRVGLPSSVVLSGELAFSVPNPNTQNQAYLDDFEASDELSLPTSRRRWSLGSRPDVPDYANTVLPFPLDAATAARLVWQHDPSQNGQIGGAFTPRNIDQQISIAGNELPESAMWLTFGDTVPNTIGKRWRSITTVLSTTGRDLTRSEFLEFYLWSTPVPGQALVIDLGSISEDAFYYDHNRLTNGTYSDNGEPWGLGVLDEEAKLAQGDIFGPDKDARGLWDQPCEANLQQQYPLGDPNANCARNNGEPDSEDLNGDGILDTNDGSYFRFVIPIDETSEFLVRDTSETKTLFRLYRVPLRTAAKSVNATDGTWRFIKHLRMTLVSEPTPQVPFQNFVFARMRIVGARWTKRDVHGISVGLLGDQPSPTGSSENFQVGPVSRLTDAEYAAPAGIHDELQDPSQRFGTAGIEFNEKSLRLNAKLAPDERAEVYFRYPQQSRAFLQYRQMRLWALPRKGVWGAGGDLEFLVKAGNDPRNYYLYRSPLKPVQAGAVNPADWLPELTIEFSRWFELREQAEQLLATGVTAPAGQSLAVWSADSTYAIVFEDRARAPNLAAMRELSFAVYNGGAAFTEAELWINDMRLSAPFKEPGAAGIVNLDIKGGDFLNASLTYANQGAVFRQLNQDPRYQTSGDFSLATTAQLGQMLPSAWGVDLPVSVVHTSSALDPMFLDGTDLRAAGLQGLRETGANATRVSVALRKRTPAANPWLGLLVDGLALRFGYNSADNSSTIARNDARGIDAGVTYARELKQRSFDIVPGFLESALRALFPARIEQSDFFRRLTSSRLRWSPERISFGSSYFDQERRLYQFNRVLELPGDTLPRPIESPREGLDNDALIVFAPFQPLRASLSFRSARDLLATERASTRSLERNAIDEARGELAGFDIGWERNRSMITDFNYRPIIAPWLRPIFNFTARYGTDRSPSYLEVNPVDSSALMQRRFQADRTVRRGLQLEPASFISALFGVPAQGYDSVMASRSALTRLSHRLVRAWQPIDLNWNSTLGSQFERERRLPGFGYQFGLGDFNGYRLIGGDTAVFVNSRDVFSLRSGVNLPLNTAIAVSYEETTLDAIDQRGGHRAQFDRVWPNLQFSWSRVPLPGFLQTLILQSTVTAGFERARQRSLLGGFARQDRGGQEYRIPVSATLGFPRGFALRYTGSFNNGENDDPTGDAENTGRDHNLTLTGYLQIPESMKEKLRDPIQINVSFREQSQRQCRFRELVGTPGTAGCVPFIDFRNRSLNFVLETTVSDLRIGMNMSYTDRQSFVGTRNGNSQFQLGLFGNFEMKAGRDLGGGGLR